MLKIETVKVEYFYFIPLQGSPSIGNKHGVKMVAAINTVYLITCSYCYSFFSFIIFFLYQ